MGFFCFIKREQVLFFALILDDPTGPGYCWSTETMRKAQIVEKVVHIRPSGRP